MLATGIGIPKSLTFIPICAVVVVFVIVFVVGDDTVFVLIFGTFQFGFLHLGHNFGLYTIGVHTWKHLLHRNLGLLKL